MILSNITRTLLRTSITNTVRLPKSTNFYYPVKVGTVKPFSIGLTYRCKEEVAAVEEGVVKDASKDRTQVIPVETSIRYLKSSAYAQTYGTDPVWKQYRRNFRGTFPPKFTRKTCIRKGVISTGNPCPICRDEYLILKPENIELLKQFISPFTGETLSPSVTGICRKKHKELIIAIELAKDRGLIEFDVPFREYDYLLYREN